MKDRVTEGLTALTMTAGLTVLLSWPVGFAWRLFRAGAGW